MLSNNVEISFNFSISGFTKQKQTDRWIFHGVKVIIDTAKMRRKEDWSYKLAAKIEGDCDGVNIQKNHDNVVLDIWSLDFFYDFTRSQEECYEFVVEDSTFREGILKKSRIKSYEIIYEFVPGNWTDEDNEETKEISKTNYINKECLDEF